MTPARDGTSNLASSLSGALTAAGRAPARAGSAPARMLNRTGAALMRALSEVRGERAVHNRGTTVSARLLVPGGGHLGVPLLDEPGRHEAVVRFSRAVGLPDPLPDVLGVGVRVLDAHGPGRHQDLLLDSVLPLPVLRRVPVPQYDLLGALYTSLTSYRLGNRRYLLGLLPDTSASRTRSLADLAGRGDGARLRLVVATGAMSWRQLAVLELGQVVPEGRSIRFSPDVTGGGIEPVGWLQELRRDAYRASHVGPDA